VRGLVPIATALPRPPQPSEGWWPVLCASIDVDGPQARGYK